MKSSGEGVNVLYMRITDVPTAPPVVLENMEILSENIKSATIEVHTPSPTPVTSKSPTSRGKIVASARAYAEPNEDRGWIFVESYWTPNSRMECQLEPLSESMGWPQTCPSSTASRGRGSTTHIVIPEPLTSAATTVAMNLLGGLL